MTVQAKARTRRKQLPWKDWIAVLMERHAEAEMPRRIAAHYRLTHRPSRDAFTITAPGTTVKTTVSKLANGAIEIKDGSGNKPNCHLCWTKGRSRWNPVYTDPALQALLSQTAAVQLLADHWQDEGVRPDDPPVIHLQSKTQLTREEASRPSWTPPTEHEDISLTKINRALEGLTDPELLNIAQTAFPHLVDLPRYNTCAAIRPALEPLLETNPGIAVWYAHHANRTELKRPPHHPGQIVKAVRRDLSLNCLDPSLWKYAASLSPYQMALIAYLDIPKNHKTMIIAAHALASQTPDHRSVRNLHHACNTIVNRWTVGEPGRPNAPLWNQTLTPEQQLSRTNTVRTSALYTQADYYLQTQHADYVKNLCAQGRVMRHPSQEHLEQAADRWHRQFQDRNLARQRLQNIQDQGGHYTAWHSLMEQTQVGEFTVTPLTDAVALINESQEMGHCIAEYTGPAASGEARYFACNSPDGRWTVEIIRAAHGWKASQTAGPGNQDPTPRAKQLATALASLYQEAEMESPTGHRPPETRILTEKTGNILTP